MHTDGGRALSMASSTTIAMASRRRLRQELLELAMDPPDGISARPRSEEDWNTWDCLIIGAEGTPYAHGAFRAVLHIPPQYPMQPPRLVFSSRMWHPNIYHGGAVR